MTSEPKRILVLSGGGGRGAFHAGVYQYLMETGKGAVDDAHSGPWKPDVVVGTSIGAVNGAAITQGITADELVKIWEGLEERDIQGIPPNMRWLARLVVSRLFGVIMDTRLPRVSENEKTSIEPETFWRPLPIVSKWFSERLVGRWTNLLDTGPLKKTLYSKFRFDAEKINQSETGLLVAATQVSTGERALFSNRELPETTRRRTRKRSNALRGITVERILASCSIPLVYPWTKDEGTNSLYWDGALVANTPLGPAFELLHDDDDMAAPVEVVVVLMTPFWEEGDPAPKSFPEKPNSFGEAISRMLDWMLLASFRETLKTLLAFNQLAEYERKAGEKSYKYREVKHIIVAPQDFMGAERIINYDRRESRQYICEGYFAAKAAFTQKFKKKTG